jgi:hypothetical protein
MIASCVGAVLPTCTCCGQRCGELRRSAHDGEHAGERRAVVNTAAARRCAPLPTLRSMHAKNAWMAGTSPTMTWATRNSFNPIFSQITTKALNGTISSITWETAEKMFLGQMIDKAFLQGAITSGLAGDAYDLVLGDGGGAPNKK